MYRARLMLLVGMAMLLGSFPSTAGETDVVVTVGTPFIPTGALFVPDDDDLVFDQEDHDVFDNDVFGEDGVAVELTLKQGEDLTYVNLDVADHTLTSVGYIPNSTLRLFDSETKSAGESGPVERADNLEPGEYKFFCLFHSSTMRGTLKVVEP